MKYRNLVSYYLIRIDESAYWRTLAPFPFIGEARTESPKTIQRYLNKIRSLGENTLEEEAEKSAQDTLRRNYDNVNFFINIIAGAHREFK